MCVYVLLYFWCGRTILGVENIVCGAFLSSSWWLSGNTLSAFVCVCLCVCLSVCLSVIISLCGWGYFFVYVDTVYGFYGYSLYA